MKSHKKKKIVTYLPINIISAIYVCKNPGAWRTISERQTCEKYVQNRVKKARMFYSIFKLYDKVQRKEKKMRNLQFK